MNENEYLVHHGVLGQKWGVHRDRTGYVSDRTKRIKREKKLKMRIAAKTYRLKKRKEQHAYRVTKKNLKKQVKDVKKQAKSKKEIDEIREKALKSVDPTFIYQNRKYLSTKELQDRITRIRNETTLKEMSDKNTKKGKDFIKSVTDFGTTVSNLYNAYNKPPFTKKGNNNNNEKKKEGVSEEGAELSEDLFDIFKNLTK